MTDRTPTGDLPDVEVTITADTSGLVSGMKDAHVGTLELAVAMLTKRAEEAERQRDDYRQRFANQMTAATELTTTLRDAERKLQQALEAIADERRGRLAAEAAVRRAREMAENEEERVARGFGYQFGGRPFPASILTRDVLAALDAEQPKETPPAEHVRGANAEDCPACSGRRDLPYPFICPGTAPAAPDTEDPVQCRTCESYILPDGIGWRHALGPADHTPEPAPDAEEIR